MQLKIEVDAEMMERLTTLAVDEKRSVTRQAEVVLRRALGLPFPKFNKNTQLDLLSGKHIRND